jgi:uncharacterized membrane protein
LKAFFGEKTELFGRNVMRRILHPVHAVLLAGMVPLFVGALICDLAYAATYELQWKNFASWLIVGGLVLGAVTLIWSLFDLRPAGLGRARGPLYFLVLLAIWVLGFINASVHARDAWASMPSGLVLSAIVALLALAATAIGFSRLRAEVSP